MRYASLLLILAAVLSAYVYVAHAYIYYRIGQGNLIFPDTTHAYTIPGTTPPRVYAALGDSLTAGVGVSTYELSYPYSLARKLAQSQAYELKVFARPGITSSGLISEYLDAAIASKPDMVTILIGTNDIHNWVRADEFETRYRHILETLATETDAEIYAISIPHIGSRFLYLPPLKWYFGYKSEEFNAIIARVSEEYGATYVDIATPTKTLLKADGELYAADSFHPSALGYKEFSDEIYARIHP